jgi:hypothetical protein
MNWKGCGKKHLWPNLRYYLAFTGRSDENYKKPVSG